MSVKSGRKSPKKVILIILASVLGAVILFTAGVFVNHAVRSARELEFLREKGYYNPVSVGDYSLNVAKFGNPNGKHTIVGLAGLGVGDYSVSARRATACLEADNRLVFVDRAGYGLSDDTSAEMTLERIVEDYRTALKNAGIEAPYILLPHSMGGAYATWWVSRYPGEIEGVVFVDGTELSEDAFAGDEDEYRADYLLSGLSKLGFGRLVLRNYCYPLPSGFSEEEQYLADALDIRTLATTASENEEGNTPENARRAFREIVPNDVPKLYIDASRGFDNWDDMEEHIQWVNERIEAGDINMSPWKSITDEEKRRGILADYERARRETLFPYLEKMGNCEYAPLGGDHYIFLQKPEECGKIIADFIDKL